MTPVGAGTASATRASRPRSRALWMVLRRTRHKLLAAAREDPLTAETVGPVIDALANAEMELIAHDPELPRRRGRGPRVAAVAATPEDGLRERIRELEREVRAREEQLAIVAHELRNPLTPVFLLVQRLRDELATLDGASVPLDWLHARFDAIADRFDQFVGKLNHLLDAGRLQAGRLVLEPEDVDLVQVVRDVVAAVGRDRPTSSPIAVHADGPVVGRWDRVRVAQIVHNLVDNALTYGDGRPIDVEVCGDGSRARLVVRDQGAGIAAEDRERIFERYERASKRSGGLGLGLWVVRRLCEAMGGTVAVDGAAGGGARFTVMLPLRPG